MGQIIDDIMNEFDLFQKEGLLNYQNIKDVLQKHLEPQKKEKEDKKDKIKLLPMTYYQGSTQECSIQTLPDRLNIIKNIEK